MVEQRLHRPLGAFETALTLTGEHAPFVVVAVIHLEDGPGPDRLRWVLDQLQRRYPLLRVRIVRRGRDFWYDSAKVPPVPLEVFRQDGEEHWKRLAEAELNRPFDAARGPLLRCSYLVPSNDSSGERTGSSDLVLTFHHAVMDGTSGTVFVNRLLALCAADESSGAAPPEEALPAVETFFPPRFRGLSGAWRRAEYLARNLGDEILFRLRSRGVRRPPIDGSARCRILCGELPREPTSALIRRLRSHRLTVATALNTAFLMAAYKHLYGGSGAPLRYMQFADLRPYLRPPVAEHHLGSFISMLRFTANLHGPQSFWPLAHRLSRQVAAGFGRGDKFTAALLAQTLMRTMIHRRSERMAATAVSYAGVTRLVDRPDGAAGVGIHAFVSNIDIGPELTAQARLFEGRLMLDAVYLDVDMDEGRAQRAMQEVLEILEEAAKGGGDNE
ncbi:MAG: condensation domain-containing protein [Acidobacteriota bacterium]|jgi:hypothetical protein